MTMYLVVVRVVVITGCAPPKSLSNIVVYLLWELCNKTSALSNSRTPKNFREKEKMMTNAVSAAAAAHALATTTNLKSEKVATEPNFGDEQMSAREKALEWIIGNDCV